MDDKEVGAPCGRKEMTEQGMPLVNPHALIPAGWLPQSQQLLVLAPVRSHQSLPGHVLSLWILGGWNQPEGALQGS